MRCVYRGTTAEEWCDSQLLARIHRQTRGRLLKESEPVAAHDFMRFLAGWQRVAKDARTSGPEALAGVLAQLEGFEAPAGAWESELLPARVSDYSLSWPDDLCTDGRIAWTRMRGIATTTDSSSAGNAPCRSKPNTMLPRWDM